MKPRLLFSMMLLASACARGQGTFVFDQQSATNETPNPSGANGTIQQGTTGFGQSFTPGFSAVDFIRLKLNDPNPSNGIGTTLFINLRTNSISGPILAATASVSFSDSFAGVADFFFSNSVPLVSGTLYYFQPVVQSGDPWNVDNGEYIYPGGTAFGQGNPVPSSDLWFREGVIVPEPSSVWLLLLGGGFFLFRRNKRCV